MSVVVKPKENGLGVKPKGETINVSPRLSKPLIIKPMIAQPVAAPIEPTFASDEVFLMRRICDVEAPILRSKGFIPKDANRPTVWKGKYRGYPVEIRFPPQYPALPFEWVWLKSPPGFPNIVYNKRGETILCIDRILDKKKWNPAIGVRGIFEMLDEHQYFRRR